ncbi:MAG: hypothetical protein COC01_05930 [Bacteroidetes bacterium]|nr:MAG: hypothetical protein COC01_05930 [Bacteroidota bacterium]
MNNWKELEKPIKEVYDLRGILDKFPKDCIYIKQSYLEIEKMWSKEFNEFNKKKKKITHVMLSEAPLWGRAQSYIYNPVSRQTSFLYGANLNEQKIKGKENLIKRMCEKGLLVLDIFPYALNDCDTFINYESLNRRDEYKELFQNVFEIYLQPKLTEIQSNNSNVKFIYRYKRVKGNSSEKLSKELKSMKFKNVPSELKLWKKGWGGMNVDILKKWLNSK